MSLKIAVACTTLWPCWFDQHEGAGAWLGAIATFMAACVALLLPFLLRWLDRVDTDRQLAWDSFLAAHHARGALLLIMELQRERFAIGQKSDRVGYFQRHKPPMFQGLGVCEVDLFAFSPTAHKVESSAELEARPFSCGLLRESHRCNNLCAAESAGWAGLTEAVLAPVGEIPGYLLQMQEAPSRVFDQLGSDRLAQSPMGGDLVHPGEGRLRQTLGVNFEQRFRKPRVAGGGQRMVRDERTHRHADRARRDKNQIGFGPQ